MSNWNDVNGNLACDYISGANNFIFAAEKICGQVEEKSADWIFKLEKPVTFLLGHASELILKAGLAKLGVLEELKHSHDLYLLITKSREQAIPLDDDFSSCVNTINDNFKNHDYRYQRSFAGFPDSEHKRLVDLQKNKPGEKKTDAELRKYGLVVNRGVDIRKFLTASQDQSQNIVKWMKSLNL